MYNSASDLSISAIFYTNFFIFQVAITTLQHFELELQRYNISSCNYNVTTFRVAITTLQHFELQLQRYNILSWNYNVTTFRVGITT